MDITVFPGRLQGTLDTIPSKSQAHRFLILAAFADAPTKLICPQINRDMEATAQCLRALGADVTWAKGVFDVTPVSGLPQQAELHCQDSGSTLRFMLPVVGAMGVDATFIMEGRLPGRPLSPLSEEMERMGCRITRPAENALRCEGKLRSGEYKLDGGVSSQFFTGLLLAGALMPGRTNIEVAGRLQSKPYVDMTVQAMSRFGISCRELSVTGGTPHSPGELNVEGDWSTAAFFLGANALGSRIRITGLLRDSAQGDRAAATLLPELVKGKQIISVADIPDLAPILAVTAAANCGCTLTDCGRLRLKESDRMEAIVSMINSLGGCASVTGDILTVSGTGLRGGVVDAGNDHRIAMSAAIAATVCREPVTILGAECAAKSFPRFFEEFRRLGGRYEQYLR